MPKLNVSVQDEQKAFEAEVAAIEKQWKSPRQAHLKRFVACLSTQFKN
jgi:isocitrate lyase